MTIRRQYSLPNCKLVLEGWSSESTLTPEQGDRPLLSMVVNAECHFVGQEKPLSGGRQFLESLVKAVNCHAQEFLSGVAHPRSPEDRRATVQLEQVGDDIHRLICRAEDTNGHQVLGVTPIQLDLKTVQLFDLVEAIDQLVADSQTLPDLKLDLAPIPKRYTKPQEPITKRALPAAIGVSGLAIMAIAIFFIPPPTFRPAESSESRSDEQSEVIPDTPSDSATSGDPPFSSSNTVSPTPSPQSENSASPSPQPPSDSRDSDRAESSEPVSSSNSQASRANFDAALNSAPPVTNPDQVEELKWQLFDQLDQAWKTTPTFTEDLIYRVGVATNGNIVGYRYENDPALEFADETPLADLRQTAANPENDRNQPIAQYRVVFRPNGALEVSPWFGIPPQ